MFALFRVDASEQLGTGHVMRCLTLAESLKTKGALCEFICRNLKGNLINFIRKKGFKVHVLSDRLEAFHVLPDERPFSEEVQNKDAIETIRCLETNKKIDWLVVDHYGFDYCWELALRKAADKLMVIDDLANRKHDCDLLLDQNYYSNLEHRYDNLVPQKCRLLLGPKYTLLRAEFRKARENLRKREGIVRRILIFLGGADPKNLTEMALLAVLQLNKPEIQVDIVVSEINPHKNKIKSLCDKNLQLHYYCNISNMAELMTKADLAIGAGGSTTWERCCLGLPCLALAFTRNQIPIVQNAAKISCLFYLEDSQNISCEKIMYNIQLAINDSYSLKQVSQNCLSLIDGDGCFRILQKMITL